MHEEESVEHGRIILLTSVRKMGALVQPNGMTLNIVFHSSSCQVTSIPWIKFCKKNMGIVERAKSSTKQGILTPKSDLV